MKVDNKILNRFDELLSIWREISQTVLIKTGSNKRVRIRGVTISPQPANRDRFYGWYVKAIYLLEQVFGKETPHYTTFNDLCKNVINSIDDSESFENAYAVLKSAREDYASGHLFTSRSLIEAEIFEDFLEQAEELLNKGYYQPAAVIAGCVLEDGIRKLCKRKNIFIINQGNKQILIDKATIDPMNIELAKAGVYNALWQKKITALSDLRNKAAHGQWTEFTDKDVEDMNRDVRRFMEDYFS